jgi:hypothetical protein
MHDVFIPQQHRSLNGAFRNRMGTRRFDNAAASVHVTSIT